MYTTWGTASQVGVAEKRQETLKTAILGARSWIRNLLNIRSFSCVAFYYWHPKVKNRHFPSVSPLQRLHRNNYYYCPFQKLEVLLHKNPTGIQALPKFRYYV
jgi:hypothetical protein